MESILKIENLDVSYSTINGPLKSLENLSVSFEKGKVTALIGESGCGKTTLMNAIMGVLAGNASIGKNSKIAFNDIDLLKLPKEKMRQFRWLKASMVFQAAQNAFNPTLTIFEQLVDAIYDHDVNMNKEQVNKRVKELLEMVKLDPKRVMDAYPHQLSGGMRQRVIIAMAMVLEPELIILDEPTTALDMITQHYIFDILISIQKKKNLSMVLITHDIGIAAKLSDNMVVMYGGEIMEIAPVKLLFEDPLHPYTKGLLDAIPFIDGEIIRKKPIEGSPPNLINKAIGCIFKDRCPVVMDICKEKTPRLKTIERKKQNCSIACYKSEEE